MKPLAIDLFCGLGGWAEGFLAEGYNVLGFDNGHTAPYAAGARYPGQLVIQDVLTLHGSQFRNAACIVASPPCQNYSYLAMPWSRSPDFVRPDGDGWEVLNSAAAKEMREKWEREGPDNRLFDACFRIQREAIEATRQPCECDGESSCEVCCGVGSFTRHIPLIVENVRGAIPWVGRSAWNYGSFHLWGDVPALMPITFKGGVKLGAGRTGKNGYGSPDYKPFGFNTENEKAVKVSGFRFDGSGRSFQTASVEGMKANPDDGVKQLHSRGDNKTAGRHRMGLGDGTKTVGHVNQRDGYSHTRHLTNQSESDAVKIGGDWLAAGRVRVRERSNARRMASAMIAKIPLPLAQHIAHVYKPRAEVTA